MSQEKGDWFLCKFCGRPAGVYPNGGGPLYGEPGETVHAAPSCEPFRRLSGEQFTGDNALSVRIELPLPVVGIPAAEPGS
jgi:hypothetical protein